MYRYSVVIQRKRDVRVEGIREVSLKEALCVFSIFKIDTHIYLVKVKAVQKKNFFFFFCVRL